MTTAFDTLTYAKQLKQSGVPEEQAEIHAQALQAVLKEHITARFDQMDQRFDRIETDLVDIKTAIVRLDGKIDALDMRMSGKVDALEERTKGRFTLLQWMLAFNLALTVAVLWLLIRTL